MKLGRERLILRGRSRTPGEPRPGLTRLRQKASSDTGACRRPCCPTRSARPRLLPPPPPPPAPSAAPRGAPHQLGRGAHAHLAQVDGEDGVRAGALHVHLGAGRGARQRPLPQALHQLWGEAGEVTTGPGRGAPHPRPPGRAHLLLGADQAGRDACGVDAAVGVLVDLDVGPAVAGVRVTGAVKQVQDLLVVELAGGTGTAAGSVWPWPGAPGLVSCLHTSSVLQMWTQRLWEVRLPPLVPCGLWVPPSFSWTGVGTAGSWAGRS